MKLAGILGGMGPQATLSLLQRILDLTPATEDRAHLPLLICSDPRIPDRTAAIRGLGPSPLPALIEAGRRLIAGGADFLAMPCNTAHVVLTELRESLPAPFIDLIDEVARILEARFPPSTPIGVLATDGTREAGLYHRGLAARGLEALDPDADEQAQVMQTIYGPDGVKAGCLNPAQAHTLIGVMTSLKRRGARAVIAGCTEIPLVLDRFRPRTPLPVISSLDVLARAVIREATAPSAGGEQRLA